MPETKDFLLVRAALPIARVSEQNPSQEMVSAEAPASILRFIVAFLNFLHCLHPSEISCAKLTFWRKTPFTK